jgi:MFS family permease
MDVPTRSSYVMAVVTEAERAAAASFTSVPRSLASALSPALAGALFAASFRALPLVICGVLKIAYDVLLLIQFRHLRPPEERAVDASHPDHNVATDVNVALPPQNDRGIKGPKGLPAIAP